MASQARVFYMMSTEYKLTHRRTRWTDRSEGNKSREGPTRSVLKQVDARRTICHTGKCAKGLRESRSEQTTTREAATNHHIPHQTSREVGLPPRCVGGDVTSLCLLFIFAKEMCVMRRAIHNVDECVCFVQSGCRA